MNCLHLSTPQVIPLAPLYILPVAVFPHLGLLSNTLQVLCIKVDFPVFNLYQKYYVPSLLIKASNSSEATHKASGGEKSIQLVNSYALLC